MFEKYKYYKFDYQNIINPRIKINKMDNNIDKLCNELYDMVIYRRIYGKGLSIISKEIDEEIAKLDFNEPKNILISNVTGKEISNSNELKELLVKQIESSVRWRESVLLMIEKGVTEFIEIGPGKVLSGLIKRIDKNVKVSAINTEEDIKLININE